MLLHLSEIVRAVPDLSINRLPVKLNGAPLTLACVRVCRQLLRRVQELKQLGLATVSGAGRRTGLVPAGRMPPLALPATTGNVVV